jgi:hypothetical protein
MDSLLPFLWGSFIPYNMPVYPGALRVADHPPGISVSLQVEHKQFIGNGHLIGSSPR